MRQCQAKKGSGGQLVRCSCHIPAGCIIPLCSCCIRLIDQSYRAGAAKFVQVLALTAAAVAAEARN